MNIVKYKNNRVVNLDAVSRLSIFVEKDPITALIKSRKIKFSMNYSIKQNNIEKADSIFWRASNQKEFDEMINYIKDSLGDSFLKVNSPKADYINLKNISSIKFKSDRNKITFNYNYSIKSRDEDIIPDYEFIFMDSNEEFNEVKASIDNICQDWFKPFDPNHSYINPNCIASVKEEEDKLRFIVNLNFCVSQPQETDKYTSTSAFIFFNLRDKYIYKEFLDSFYHFTNKGEQWTN